jgi:hypothetical protein
MGLLAEEPLVLGRMGYVREYESLQLLQIRPRNRSAGEWGLMQEAGLEGCLSGSVAAWLFRGSVEMVLGR